MDIKLPKPASLLWHKLQDLRDLPTAPDEIIEVARATAAQQQLDILARAIAFNARRCSLERTVDRRTDTFPILPALQRLVEMGKCTETPLRELANTAAGYTVCLEGVSFSDSQLLYNTMRVWTQKAPGMPLADFLQPFEIVDGHIVLEQDHFESALNHGFMGLTGNLARCQKLHPHIVGLRYEDTTLNREALNELMSDLKFLERIVLPVQLARFLEGRNIWNGQPQQLPVSLAQQLCGPFAEWKSLGTLKSCREQSLTPVSEEPEPTQPLKIGAELIADVDPEVFWHQLDFVMGYLRPDDVVEIGEQTIGVAALKRVAECALGEGEDFPLTPTDLLPHGLFICTLPYHEGEVPMSPALTYAASDLFRLKFRVGMGDARDKTLTLEHPAECVEQFYHEQIALRPYTFLEKGLIDRLRQIGRHLQIWSQLQLDFSSRPVSAEEIINAFEQVDTLLTNAQLGLAAILVEKLQVACENLRQYDLVAACAFAAWMVWNKTWPLPEYDDEMPHDVCRKHFLFPKCGTLPILRIWEQSFKESTKTAIPIPPWIGFSAKQMIQHTAIDIAKGDNPEADLGPVISHHLAICQAHECDHLAAFADQLQQCRTLRPSFPQRLCISKSPLNLLINLQRLTLDASFLVSMPEDGPLPPSTPRLCLDLTTAGSKRKHLDRLLSQFTGVETLEVSTGIAGLHFFNIAPDEECPLLPNIKRLSLCLWEEQEKDLGALRSGPWMQKMIKRVPNASDFLLRFTSTMWQSIGTAHKFNVSEWADAIRAHEALQTVTIWDCPLLDLKMLENVLQSRSLKHLVLGYEGIKPHKDVLPQDIIHRCQDAGVQLELVGSGWEGNRWAPLSTVILQATAPSSSKEEETGS